jgi:hypothetical protein
VLAGGQGTKRCDAASCVAQHRECLSVPCPEHRLRLISTWCPRVVAGVLPNASAQRTNKFPVCTAFKALIESCWRVSKVCMSSHQARLTVSVAYSPLPRWRASTHAKWRIFIDSVMAGHLNGSQPRSAHLAVDRRVCRSGRTLIRAAARGLADRSSFADQSVASKASKALVSGLTSVVNAVIPPQPEARQQGTKH